MNIEKIKDQIENLDINKPSKQDVEAIEETIKLLDTGVIRVAEQREDGWAVNEWVKQAILHYFVVKKLRKIESGELEYLDKIGPKKNYEELNLRVVPPGVVRYGAFCEPGVVIMPVIVEDGAFIGSRSIIVEGVRIEKGAVIGANVTITGSTPIIDVTGENEKEYKGLVPSNSVVIPGTRPKSFPSGEFQTPCALIIGKRKESTNQKTSLNDALRTFGVDV